MGSEHSREEIRAVLKASETVVVATHGGGGEIRTRQMHFVVDLTGPSTISLRSANLNGTGRVSGGLLMYSLPFISIEMINSSWLDSNSDITVFAELVGMASW